MRVRFLLSETAQGITRERTLTIAALLTTAIALTLLGTSLMVRAGAASLRAELVNRDDVSVYVEPDCAGDGSSAMCLTSGEHAAIARDLRDLATAQSVVYVSAPQSQQFFEQFVGGANALFFNTNLTPYFAVQVSSHGTPQAVRLALLGQRGVTSVGGTSPADQAVLSFFHQVSTVSLVAALSFTLLAGVLIYVTATVAAFSNRNETAVMQLVGASAAQVRLPVVLRGATIGLLSSLIAATSLLVLRWTVAITTTARALSPLGRWSTFWHAAPYLFVIGPSLAAIAWWLTLSRHLERPERPSRSDL